MDIFSKGDFLTEIDRPISFSN